ncbi:glycosyltransferase [Geobacillus icigianus]|uniref:glycosyltransferase n=1 Tax=Geobacillus icigianus TaxID=1430331 RepID=UPI003D049708
MRKNMHPQEAVSPLIFYDAKGRRKVIVKAVLFVSIIVTVIVFYAFFRSIFSPIHLPYENVFPTTTKKMISSDEKIGDWQLQEELKLDKNRNYHHWKQWKQNTDHSKPNEVYGFYVNWDENSTSSLKDHIRSLTVLVPEWYHLNRDLTITSEKRADIVKLAKDHHVKIVPLINNFTAESAGPDSSIVDRLLRAPTDQQKQVIANLEKQIEDNHFAGVNIDFESIPVQDRQALTKFMKELAFAFHQHRLLVTQDVPADDRAFDYRALSKEVDRLIVMMYDEHYTGGDPGPIASIGWFQHTLEHLPIPPEKRIIALGNYGYDWTIGGKTPAVSLTFSDIMDIAGDGDLKIKWDKLSENPYIEYENGKDKHIVWFLDSVTFYNEMKLASENGTRGFALWRIGAEDPTVWELLKNGVKKISLLRTIPSTDRVAYSGKGEILRVVHVGRNGSREFHLDPSGNLTDERYQSFPLSYDVERYGQPKEKKVVLTFDDGPNPKYTPEILDILKQFHVKADFFVVGENAGEYPDIMKRMYNEGHEIGNHTFTHPNIAETSPLRTKLELNATQRLIQEVTGHSTVLFRPPYEADAEPYLASEILPILRAQKMNYIMVGEKVDPQDWTRPAVKEIVKRVVTPILRGEGNVILLHDAGGDRTRTVEALPIIIKTLREHGYRFVTIAGLLGKKRDDVMPSVYSYDALWLPYDRAVFSGMEYFTKIVTIIFYVTIGLGIFRLLFFVYFSFKQKRRSQSHSITDDQPLVSVVIAAYNEEKVIGNAIHSILASDYPSLEVIVVDDGSRDNTAKVVGAIGRKYPNVHLIQKENGGKASAINRGFLEARGDIIVSLDADTILAPNAISLMVRHFADPHVAAVSGNVKVGNRRKLLTVWQHIEYVTGFNLERRAFDELNCITVVPGAIGAWRKQLVKQVGYVSEDTLAEDTDLTLTLLRQGYRIVYEDQAYGYTESPEDVKSLVKQRYRWSYGTLQCLWKHRKALFNPKHKSLGFIALPNMWIFQFLSQSVSPFVDLLMVISLLSNHPFKVLGFYLLFVAIDLFASLFAFSLEKENPKPLLWLVVQRFIYRQIMTYVVIKSILSAIQGVEVGWNKLKRFGSVERSFSQNKTSIS